MPLDSTNYDIDQRDDILDLLRRARERVARPGGWHQGWYENDQGGRCALGQLCEDNVFNLFDVLKCEAARCLERELPPAVMRTRIQDYNDASGRTQAEIVALFDQAIAKREAEV